MPPDHEETDAHVLRRWFSVGDVVSALVVLCTVAAMWGSLTSEISRLAQDVAELRAREITPGAERRIAVLEAQVTQQRMDAADQRRELRAQLDRIEAKIDAHLEERER